MATMGKVTLGDSTKLLNNIISNEKLKDIQKRVLDDLKNAIIPSMGPAGSNTLIIRGSNDQNIQKMVIKSLSILNINIQSKCLSNQKLRMLLDISKKL